MVDVEKSMDDILNSTIAQMLRNARKKTGLTQQQLSDKYEIPLRSLQAWEGIRRVPPTYVVNLLLRCLAIDFPTAHEVSSEQTEQRELVTKSTEPVKKPSYTLHTSWGKHLTPEQEADVEKARACGEVAQVSASDEDPTIKQYMCTENGFIFEVRPIKEV